MGAVVVVALIAAVGYGAWSYLSVKRVGGLDLSEAADSTPQNFLIVGSDSRANVEKGTAGSGAMLSGATGGQRSDSISIARIDPGSDRIDMLSIPRDLWLPIAGTGKEQRINTAYSKSTQALIDTIEQQLKIPINHFVEVDFVGFQN
ncbi:MAG: LCP family protein, partial [Actinomycetes bacterium]